MANVQGVRQGLGQDGVNVPAPNPVNQVVVPGPPVAQAAGGLQANNNNGPPAGVNIALQPAQIRFNLPPRVPINRRNQRRPNQNGHPARRPPPQANYQRPVAAPVNPALQQQAAFPLPNPVAGVPAPGPIPVPPFPAPGPANPAPPPAQAGVAGAGAAPNAVPPAAPLPNPANVQVVQAAAIAAPIAAPDMAGRGHNAPTRPTGDFLSASTLGTLHYIGAVAGRGAMLVGGLGVLRGLGQIACGDRVGKVRGALTIARAATTIIVGSLIAHYADKELAVPDVYMPADAIERMEEAAVDLGEEARLVILNNDQDGAQAGPPVVYQGLANQVRVACFGKVRTQENWEKIERGLEREWNNRGLGLSDQLALKSMAYCVFYTIPEEERRVMNYISQGVNAQYLNRHNRFIRTGINRPLSWFGRAWHAIVRPIQTLEFRAI